MPTTLETDLDKTIAGIENLLPNPLPTPTLTEQVDGLVCLVGMLAVLAVPIPKDVLQGVMFGIFTLNNLRKGTSQ